MTIEKLIPTNGQKSFGGKALVITTDDGWMILKSYSTIVAGIGPRGGMLRYSDARSATTGRHVRSFFARYAGYDLTTKEFYSWPVERNIHYELEEEQ